MPVARVANLASTIDELKEKNIWIYGADMDGSDYRSVDYSGGVALVIGSEGRGMSRLVREKCDFIVSLPMKGKINSSLCMRRRRTDKNWGVKNGRP